MALHLLDPQPLAESLPDPQVLHKRRALAGLPLITAEFAAGRLSYSKVRAITRIATPDTEHTLLELALAGTAAHVEQVVALTRRCGTQAAAAAAQRFLRWEWAEDGSLLLRARLPAEHGALLLAALQALTEPPDGPAEHPQPAPEHGSAEPSDADPEPETEPGPPPNWQAEQAERAAAAVEYAPGAAVDRVAARRADALVALAETALHATAATSSQSESDRYQIVVHLHAGSGNAELEGGPALPASTTERIACTARVSALIRDRHGNPLYLGRRRRLVTKTLLRALAARDGHRCRFPGCTSRRVQAHHIITWLSGGLTDIDNLVLLCRFHHALIHDRSYQLRWVNDQLEFRRPDGKLVPQAGPPINGDLDQLVEAHTLRNLQITDTTLTPSWGGEPLDPTPILERLLPEPTATIAA